MATKVFAAARAVRLLKNTDAQTAWAEYTRMFDLADDRNISAKTFIYGGYPFDEKVRGARATARGDAFKAITVHQTVIYTEIVDWNPFERFAFIEYVWQPNEPRPGDADRTDFHFRRHPEGTMLEIVRRETGDIKVGLLDRLSGRKNEASWAAGRLGHIIGGSGSGFDLKNGASVEVRDFTITREDSLRKDFSEGPSLA